MFMYIYTHTHTHIQYRVKAEPYSTPYRRPAAARTRVNPVMNYTLSYLFVHFPVRVCSCPLCIINRP